MSHDRLHYMKETLMDVVEMQLCDLDKVDTKELGEAIDMIKDLEEAIYYCTVTEAMNTGSTWEMKKSDHHQEYDDSRMYDKANHVERDEREGRSYNSRRMYIEAKDMKRDKATQLRELEKYIQELSQDITEMIADASPEEKQYLEKKITALASKIGQMK